MRVLVIDNLRSGLQDGAIHDFIRRFIRDGDELTIRASSGETRIESFLGDAIDFDLVVASGGDSTIATVCYQLRDSDTPVLAFPAGTSNLIANNLKLPEEPLALASTARQLVSANFDLGLLNNAANPKAAHGFAVMAGAGYDANIMRRSERLKGQFGPAAYVAAAITNPMPTVAHFSIGLDDEVLEVDGIAVLVINFAEIFPDISITHGNDAQDGMFEVVVIKPHSAMELLPALFAAFLDSVGSFPGRFDAIEVRRSRQVYVQSDPIMAIQIDGEAQNATTPFHAQILPAAARLVITSEELERLLAKRQAMPMSL
jgi:diacylglycerol kinase family enzyme